MTKFIKLAQLRSIALHADVICDVADAIRNSLAAHEGHGDRHLVSVPESISDLIGLVEEEVTKMLFPAVKTPVSPVVSTVAPVVSSVAPVVSEPAPEVATIADVDLSKGPTVVDLPADPITPDPLG